MNEKRHFLMFFLFSFSILYANYLNNFEIRKLTPKEEIQLKADIHNKNIFYQKNIQKIKGKNIAKIIPEGVFLVSKKGTKIIVKDFVITTAFLKGAKKVINSDKNFNKKINQKQLLFILKNIYYKNVLQNVCSKIYHKRILFSGYKYVYRFFSENKKNKPIFVFMIDNKKCNLLSKITNKKDNKWLTKKH